MARPKQYPDERIQAQIRFMPDTHERLKALADARMVSLAYLVEQAVLAALPGWEAETKTAPRKVVPVKKAAAAKKATNNVPPKKAAAKKAATPSKTPRRKAVAAAS